MENLAQRCIESTAVSPHWLSCGNAFWYRRKSEAGHFQFILVDASQRTRDLAFDHKQLALALEEKTGEKIDETALPFTWIEPVPDDSCTRFSFSGRKWQYGPGNELREWDGEFTHKPDHFLKEIEPSSSSSSQISVDFVNRTGETLKLFWIDWDAEPVFYASIENGATERQGTYVGHVWRLVDASTEKTIAIYAAPNQTNDIVIVEHSDDPAPEICSPASDGVSEAHKESVDSRTGPLYVQDFNLWFRDQHNREIQLSSNGSADNPYDKGQLHMSPNERYAVAWQYTPRQDHKVNLLESSPDDQMEPKLHTIQYLKPGDRVRVDRPRIFDLDKHCEVSTDDTLFKNPYDLRNLGWNSSSEEYRFLFNERGHQHVRIIGISVDGHVRTVVEEESRTFVDYTKLFYRVLKDSDELLWTSERDGYNHLYLIDLVSGAVRTQMTRGAWSVGLVEFVEEDHRRVWVQGYGLESDEDPYHAHLACVNFDASGFRILTDGDGTHSWTWSPDRSYFVDTWSRVDHPPRTVLRDTESGECLLELEAGSIEDLERAGWSPPERFSAPARDGSAPTYGIIIRPADFDSTKKYPIIDDIYSGPHDFHVPKSFSALKANRQWADQGYIVVQIDGMGTNWRGKAFHDVCYKKLHDSGIPDHIAWLKAAAADRPWLDLSRVGIMGVSAGGQSAVAALLHHGDFYKAAIADSGCHDNRMDKIWWNELWMGYPVDEAYKDSSNMTHASKLQGALMLIVGDLDSNVDPSSTLQLVHALNKAGKNYEFLLIPGGEHGCGASPYGLARQRGFFRRHLQKELEYRVDLLDADEIC
ncbi:hypothetical protein ACJ41O_004385 [Fusarium nematophilum]